MKVAIDLKALKAVSLFAAKDDVRYYLQGVYVEFNPQSIRVVATNGHILGVYNQPLDEANEGAGSFIIPLETVKEILRWKLPKVFNLVTFSSDDGDKFTAECADKAMIFKRIDGTFPDYRRVIPAQSDDNGFALCAPNYLDVCFEARRILTGKKDAFPQFKYNGENSAVLAKIHDDMLAVVMPMRHDQILMEDSSFADWARAPLNAPADAPAETANNVAVETESVTC